MKNHICTILCILTLLGFFILFIQEQWKPIHLKPLNGYVPSTEKPKLTLTSFSSGEYQSEMEHYISENFGFREFFIRLYNQYSYSLFRKINNENIVEGVDHELYLNMYLNDITGKTLWGYYPSIEEAKADARKNVQETMKLIDTLKQFDIDFLFIFAPTKTAIYPEKMPQKYQEQISDFSLEEYYIELFKENDIPHIDFLNYFKAIKDTVAYPLYPQTGTHWAESTIPFVADSILKKLSSITNYNLPSVQYIDDNLTTDYSVQDGELEASMNLLFPLNKPALPRPVFELTDTMADIKPNLLVVGDSYFAQLRLSCFVKAFNRWDYWEYNKNILSSRPRFHWKILKEEFDAVTVLQEADIVMAVFTAPMMYNYMFGFTSTAQELLEKGYFNEEEAMETVIKMIQDTPQWYEGVMKQAEERGITIEESLTKNARYWLDHQKFKIKRPKKKS